MYSNVCRLFVMFSNGMVIRIHATRLRSLGLTSLVQLGRGDVLINHNPDLCYADTVSWDTLRISEEAKKSGRIIIRDNRNTSLCGR